MSHPKTRISNESSTVLKGIATRDHHHNSPTGATASAPGSALARERVGLDALASDDVESSIVTLVGRLSSSTFDLLVLIGEFDARGTWAVRGALSCS